MVPIFTLHTPCLNPSILALSRTTKGENISTHVVVTCHRCGHTWAYMGSKVATVERGERKGLWASCRCGTNTRLVKIK